jgi:hypothetical protein
MRIKAFAYVYHMTNDTKWVDRCWEEVQVRCRLFDLRSVSYIDLSERWGTQFRS